MSFFSSPEGQAFASFVLHPRAAMDEELRDSLDFVDPVNGAADCLEQHEEHAHAVEEPEGDGMPKKKRRKHRRCTASTAVSQPEEAPPKKEAQPEEAHEKKSKKKEPKGPQSHGSRGERGTELPNDPIVIMGDLLNAIDFEFGPEKAKPNAKGLTDLLCSQKYVEKIRIIFERFGRKPLVVSGAALSEKWEEDQGDQMVWWNALLAFLDVLTLKNQTEFEVDSELYFPYYRNVRALLGHTKKIQEYLMANKLFHFETSEAPAACV